MLLPSGTNMNGSEKFYREKLYPLQNGVLMLVKSIGVPFYLTGGTALSRVYYNHRYSDDLDFFVNNDPGYAEYTRLLYQALVRDNYYLPERMIIRSENYSQFMVERENIQLKIDLVNDIAERIGLPVHTSEFGLVDTIENILTNKLSALFRFEAKDIADIIEIASHNAFSWGKMMDGAKKKEAAIDPVTIYEILKSFPGKEFSAVKFANEIDINDKMARLHRIADDILKGNDNTLFPL